MTAKEQWQAWRSGDASAGVGVDDFIRWVESFTSAAEDEEGLFTRWRETADRESCLRRILGGEVVGLGARPQFLFGLFYGLYQIVQGRRCFVCTAEPIDSVYCRAVLKRLTDLGRLNVLKRGAMLGGERFYLGNCQDVDLALVDYIELMSSKRRNAELFASLVQSLFLLEIDLPLYTMRVVTLDHGVERAAGMIYHSTGKVPEAWKEGGDIVDTVRILLEMKGIEWGGCYSYMSEYVCEELNTLLAPMLKAKISHVSRKPFMSYTFRKNEDRVRNLVRDVLQTPGNALVVCCTELIRDALQDEFRKAGQEVTFSVNGMDATTSFSKVGMTEGKKKVLIMTTFPSTMTVSAKPVCKGALYLAEHFLATNIEEKALAVSESIFEETHYPRMYFSLDDLLFKAYEEQGSFKRLFTLIDFTEKYDPWCQIRRVLARSMEKKLHRLRCQSMDEDMPMITLRLDDNMEKHFTKNSKPNLTSKLDAPCFCGSGKPFRECHGKKKA